MLKRHKILPHPQRPELPVDDYVQNPRHKLSLDTNIPSSPESSTSHTLKHSSKRIGVPSLPLTPPAHSRQSSAGHVSFQSAGEDILPPAPSIPGTPPNQQSPPTPDVTPPKTAWKTSGLRPFVYERYPSSRADSFKTAKETQTPNQSDEDDFFRLRPALQPSQPSSQETVQWAPLYKATKPIGLGLGLESDEGRETPKPARDFIAFDGEWGSGTEDISEVEREWDDNLMRNVTVRKRPVLEAFNDSPCPPGPTHEVFDNREVEPSNATKQLRRLSLHDRIGNLREERDANRGMKEKSGIRSTSPAAVRDSDVSMADTRRFSTLSGRSQASTVVSAMVVEAPTPRPNGLRRTKKRIALRDCSAPEKSLREQSRSPANPPRRLTHKNSRIPERSHQSLGSTDTGRTVSTSSSSGRSRKEVLESGAIPVVVVPERLSSSKKAQTPSLRSTSSRHTRGSRSVSATSTAPVSSSAKANGVGYFDSNKRPRAKTLSESKNIMGDEERTFDIEPIVPVRTSSLSATTSRNNSRSGSLTAESLRALNESQAPLFLPRSIVQFQKQLPEIPRIPHQSTSSTPMDHSQPERRKSLDQNGDPFFGNRLSTQVTPFSQISYGTSGTAAEVSEALAVPLFPHNNGSLHMIQQQSVDHNSIKAKQVSVSKGPKESAQRSLGAVKELPARPMMKVNDQPTSGPVTPPQPIQPLSMGDVDSPLRNPRQAPEPPQNQLPSIKFIPPTPASEEEDRQLGHSLDLVQESMPPIEETEDKPKRGLSLVRRALSKRRYSEGFILGLGRKFSTKEKYEDPRPGTSGSNVDVDPLYPAADIPSDTSRLHPFWRPARFWEDLENEQQASDEWDEEPREYGSVLYKNGAYPSVDMRPMPRRKFSLKRTFAILPIKDDHDHLSGYDTDRRTVRRSPSGNMRVVKKTGSNSSLRRMASERRIVSEQTSSQNRRFQPTGFAGRPATSDGLSADNGRVHTIPGIGVRFEYVGFKGLQARLRERNNRKLKSRISAPRGAWHGDDAVLESRAAPLPLPRVIKNGSGYVLVSRKGKAKRYAGGSVMDGNGGLGEQI